MSEITRAYEFVVMATDGTTPDLTFTDSDFAGSVPPTYGAWRVNELQGDSEGEPFTVSILDTGGQVTANLSDGSGRADLMGRVWRLRINENGGGLAIVAMGRIVGVQMSGTVGAYDFQCGDERHWTRNRTVYRTASTPTTQFYPPGLRAPWLDALRLADTIIIEAEDVSDPNKVHFVVRGGEPMSEEMVAWLEDDMKSTTDRGGITGNFDTLRINIGGTDREITNFNASDNRAPLLQVARSDSDRVVRDVWVRWLAHGVSFEQIFTGVFMHAPTAEPSETVPFHIGGDTRAGIDLIQELKDRYDEEGVRYDANAFSTWDATTNPTGLIAHPNIGTGHLRLTEPQNLARFESAIFKSRGLAPFPNASGEITPRFVTLPDTINPSALTQVTAAKLRGTHPTWQQLGQDIVTVLTAEFETMRQLSLDTIEESSSWPADQIEIKDAKPAVFEHDRIADLGRHDHNVKMTGLWSGKAASGGLHLSEEIFNRYGDGPIRGRFGGMSSIDGIAAGDFVVIDLSSYPDIATQTRGGLRLVQAMEIRRGPSGGEFEYVDAGADTDALAAPTVAIIRTVALPKHSVDVTITGLPAGSTYLLQLKIGSDAYKTVGVGTANETVTFANMPSNTLITPRVKAVIVAQVGSAWATVAGVTTDAMAVPSGLSATASGTTIVLTWTNGEADERIMPTLAGADYLNTPLEAGTSRWVFTNLTPSTLHTVGVKHVDDFGGESALVTTTDTTATAATLAAPRKLTVLQGATIATEIILPEDLKFGGGIEYGVERADPHSQIQLQVSTSSAFVTIESTTMLTDETSVRVTIPLDNVVRFCRARSIREGWTASAWTATVSARPTPFTLEVGFAKEVLELTSTAVPHVEVGSQLRGVFLDAVFRLSAGVVDAEFRFTWDDGSPHEFAEVVSDVPQEGTQRIQNVGDFHFLEGFTGITITVTPFENGVASGNPVTIAVEDVDEMGSGTKAFLSAGGTALTDGFVPGSNVMIDLDGDGRPRINSSGPGAGVLNDLTDVTISSAANLDVLAHNGTIWGDVALTAAHIQSGVFADARIAESNVTQHEAALAIAASQVTAGTFGAGNFTFPADLTITDQLRVSGVGPHAIGGAISAISQMIFTGAFTSDGSANRAAAFEIRSDITGAPADTSALVTFALGGHIGSSIVTQTATESIADVATILVSEPAITNNLTGSITNATTFKILNAPTEGVNNRALWVPSGLVEFGGQVDFAIGSISVVGTITGLSWAGVDIGASFLPAISGLDGYVANEHVDHSTVAITGTGNLGGGGTITASRTITMDADITLTSVGCSGDIISNIP